MQIVQAPNPILAKPATATPPSGPKLEKILSEMKKTLLAERDPEGVGLAANQVGLPYKLFLARFSTKKNEPVRAFLNPEVLSHSDDLQSGGKDKLPLEGCLSVPKYFGPVRRWQWVTLKYQELTPNYELITKNSKFEDFPAIVIQHEMDHLAGKIFTERILEQKGKLYKITGKDKRGKDEWEEIQLT